ncbi:HNH endonuclease signature motif containing protein [Williamsia sp. 1135]|uniref:HNH endonuclease signature motif containing protein n=1 Tax=Williamsia sp. 1135 TaxID=1889262 RepID=UPI00143ABFF1|nr:HNH endonuclease signature motif containing protein [Williamsia sp. 1135]
MAWVGTATMDAEASELLSRVQSGTREVNQAWAARLDDGLAYYRYVSSNEDEHGTRAAACEIAVAWRCTTGQADHLLRCRRLLDHLPELAEAFSAGEVSIEKLKALYHRASRGYRDALMDLDGVLAEDAMLLGDNTFAEELDRHLMPFEPDRPDDDGAVDPMRRVTVRRRADGMASLTTGCTAEEAIRAKAQLEEMALDDPAGEVDAVLDAIANANAAATEDAEPEPEPEVEPEPEPAARPSAAAPSRTAKRAWTELVLDLPTLLGLSKDPGYLLGYGSLDCDQSRSLAGRSRWRALVTIGEDAIAALVELINAAQGRPVTAEELTVALMNAVDNGDRLVLGEKDVGPAPPVKAPHSKDGHGGWKRPPRGALKYKPGRKLARLIRALDGTCRFSGCKKPAKDCEIDHIVPFNHDNPMAGGWTIESNLACLCKEHHDLKTRGIIRVEMRGNREYWIDTRAGQRVVTKPAVRRQTG